MSVIPPAEGQPGKAPVGGDLGSVLGELGIDPSMVAPGGSFGEPTFQWSVPAEKIDDPLARFARPRRRQMTAAEVFRLFGTMSTTERARLQRKLFNAGLYDASFYGPNSRAPQFGKVDIESYQALSRAVQMASDTGDLDQILNLEVPPEALSAGGGREPLTMVVTNREDIRADAEDLAREVLGYGRLDDELIDRIASRIWGEERRAQQQAYDTQETGGEVARAMSPQAIIRAELENSNPDAAFATGFLEQSAGFLDLIRGSGG